MRSAKKLLSFVTTFCLFLSTNSLIVLAGTLPAVPEPLAIAEEAFTLPEAKEGAEYKYLFQSEGGMAPLTWKIIKGYLPSGLLLEPSGELHGVPKQSRRDAYGFIVEVSDSSRTPQHFSMPFLLTVQAAPLRIVTAVNPARLKILTGTGDQSNVSGASPTPSGDWSERNSDPRQESESLRAGLEKFTGRINNAVAAERRSVIPGITPVSSQDSPQIPSRPAPSSRPGAPERADSTNSQPSSALNTTPAAAAGTGNTTLPAPSPSPGTAKICGRLRPASMDRILALLSPELPIFREPLANFKKLEDEIRPSVEEDCNIADDDKEAEIEKRAIESMNIGRNRKEIEKEIRKIVESDKSISSGQQNAEIEKRVTAREKLCDSAYPANLLATIHRRSRFKSDTADSTGNGKSCEERENVRLGEQKEAVVKLLFWLLDEEKGAANGNNKTNWDDVSSQVRAITKGSSPELSKDVVRRQILQLNQYLGNVTVRLRIPQKKVGAEVVPDKIVTAVSDRDGNFFFKEVPTADQQNSQVVMLTTEGDDEYTKREFSVKHGDEVRLDLPIEDRPVSLMARAVVGYQQAGAAATKFEQNYFFDIFLSKSLPFQQSISPDFGERGRIWGAVRAISVPNTDNFTIADAASSFVAKISVLKVNEAARVFDYLGGFEYRIGGNNALLPSFDRQTKQKFSFSLIGSFGFVTPTDPLEKDPLPVYSITPQLRKVLEERKLLTSKDDDPNKNKTNAVFVPNDRDRFFRQYYGGIRVQTYFFNRHNVPMQRFPAQLDFTVGQNEYVTGGRFNGPVFRLDGYYPLPYEGLKFISLFGMAVFKPTRVKETTPLLLKPADANVKPYDDSVLIVPVSQFNRDYYRVGVGIDFLSFVQKLLNRN